MVDMAAIYEEGYLPNIQQDYQKAYDLYSQAAQQGQSKGWLNMGLMCQQGKHVPENQEAALEHFRKAAALDNPEAQDLLAMQGLHFESSLYTRETQGSA